MPLDEVHHLIAIVVRQPPGLSRTIHAKIFGAPFQGRKLLGQRRRHLCHLLRSIALLGRYSGDLLKAHLSWTLVRRSDVPLSDLPGHITTRLHDLRQSGASTGYGHAS